MRHQCITWLSPLLFSALIVGCEAYHGINPEEPPPTSYPHDIAMDQGHRPNPNFVADPEPAHGIVAQPLRVEGEVFVIEGASGFVTQGGGEVGITNDNQKAIVQEVLSQYPDRFDTIAIFLSFTDANHVGTAYYQGVRNEVAGIGRSAYNSRRSWGLPPRGGRFSGFVNMNSVEMFGGLSSAGSPKSRYHAVLAQELSHRWLMFFKFKGADGMTNTSLLGRDDAHWSPLVQAYASVQDGVEWRDNGDGSFTHFGTERGFAPLDLYGMGVYGPSEVENFFYIAEASLDGMPLDKDSRIPMGTTISGTKVDVSVEQVVAEMGPRNPPKGTETPYYRSAFILITRPGQSQSEWQPYLEAVQAAQTTFPGTWKEWSLGASALCTKVTGPCPEPDLGLHSYDIQGGDQGDVGPGDTFQLQLQVRNDGLGIADNVQVTVDALTEGVVTQGEQGTVSGIDEGKFASVSPSFSVQLGSELACGDTISLLVTMTSQEGPTFTDKIDMVIGYRQLKYDPLHESPDWTVDPDSNDTAEAGVWGLGEPEFVSILGVVTQPAEDHSPGEGKLSFHTGPYKGANFSAEDLDGGRTTLQSPVFAIKDAIYPSLSFYVWHVAKDFSIAGGPEDVEADVVVSASNDGGETWVEIDRFGENTSDWVRRDIPLRPFLEPTNRMRFRFVIEDSSDSANVEAGIDDLEIVDILPSCEVPDIMADPGMGGGGGASARRDDEDAGCGCSAVHAPLGEQAATSSLALLGLLLVLARRRK